MALKHRNFRSGSALFSWSYYGDIASSNFADDFSFFIWFILFWWAKKGINSTPFLESLLSNGNTTLYPKSYTTQRCSPSRAALMTGIYPFRYGLGEFWKKFKLFVQNFHVGYFKIRDRKTCTKRCICSYCRSRSKVQGWFEWVQFSDSLDWRKNQLK